MRKIDESPAAVKRWEYGIFKSYKITGEQYRALLAAQGGRCAICLKPPKGRRLSVDHNHKTGEIRGLLCYNCNHNTLGRYHENAELFDRAAAYIRNPPARKVLSLVVHDIPVVESVGNLPPLKPGTGPLESRSYPSTQRSGEEVVENSTPDQSDRRSARDRRTKRNNSGGLR